jgi:hypothetical protein
MPEAIVDCERTQANLSDLIFSYLRRELQRKARKLKSSTIDVANGTNINGKVVRSARSSVRAIATAPPTPPATKPTISLPWSRKETARSLMREERRTYIHGCTKRKRAAARKARRPSEGAGISAYFKLSRVMSKASFATTVEPHQLDTKPAGLAFDTWLGLNEDVCELV